METNRSRPVIALDAGGVLNEFDFGKVLVELSENYGLDDGNASIEPFSGIFRPLELGEQTFDTIAPKLNQTLGVSLPPGEWKELCCRIFVGEVPGMRDLLGELKPDFSLIALSNTMEAHWEYLLGAYPIFQLLDGWMVSYEVGIMKPDAEIYRAFSDRFCDGKPPFFFTDDAPGNIDAATNLGWKAEVFRDAPTLNAQLAELRR